MSLHHHASHNVALFRKSINEFQTISSRDKTDVDNSRILESGWTRYGDPVEFGIISYFDVTRCNSPVILTLVAPLVDGYMTKYSIEELIITAHSSVTEM